MARHCRTPRDGGCRGRRATARVVFKGGRTLVAYIAKIKKSNHVLSNTLGTFCETFHMFDF
jgi:hypothetical protein